MEYNLHKVIEEMVIEFKETEEEFIFTHLQPYCENVLEMKIDKEELKQILLRGTKTGKWIFNKNMHDYCCSECGCLMPNVNEYYRKKIIGCPYCLADMRGSDQSDS